MSDLLMPMTSPLLAVTVGDIASAIWPYFLIFLGFSAVIFVHELGHFLAAKWAGVRVEKFCIGFGKEIIGFTHGETRYAFNILPLGGYVKMMGQEDFEIDASGELQHKEDPRSFVNKPVGKRAVIVSAGVIMNVLFAALLFMIVFMMGMEVIVTDVGFVRPNSPAAMAGLQIGDKIREIDGDPVIQFREILMAVTLGDPHEPMDFLVERDGQLIHLPILPEVRDGRPNLEIGMGPSVTNLVLTSPPGSDPDRDDVAKPGDRIVEINGQPVTEQNANEMYFAMVKDPGQIPSVVVERPEEPFKEGSPTRRVKISVLPQIGISPSDVDNQDSVNVLGLTPLMRFATVTPKGPAEKAGIKEGDVITRIADIDLPSQRQIGLAIERACKKSTGPEPDDFDYQQADVPIEVYRAGDGKTHKLTLRPKVVKRLVSRNKPPEIEASYSIIADDYLRIGKNYETIDGQPTPAAASGIPAGVIIERVGDVAVTSWVGLVEQLARAAGSRVALHWTDARGNKGSSELAVPRSLRTEMGLPVVSTIVSVGGVETVNVSVRGRTRQLSVSHWYGLKAVLKERVGQTVDVTYRRGLFGDTETASVNISEDMLDPWLGRIEYRPNINTAQQRMPYQTTNPITAITTGVKQTVYFVVQVYIVMKRMIFTRTVGVEQLSGPVGIVKMGSDMANVGIRELLFFLAIISANLAVINFLPLPIVDGGLMVFLIVEKIKGTPVSIKTQVITQVIGLFLIVGAFIFVTYQDIVRLMFG